MSPFPTRAGDSGYLVADPAWLRHLLTWIALSFPTMASSQSLSINVEQLPGAVMSSAGPFSADSTTIYVKDGSEVVVYATATVGATASLTSLEINLYRPQLIRTVQGSRSKNSGTTRFGLCSHSKTCREVIRLAVTTATGPAQVVANAGGKPSVHKTAWARTVKLNLVPVAYFSNAPNTLNPTLSITCSGASVQSISANPIYVFDNGTTNAPKLKVAHFFASFKYVGPNPQNAGEPTCANMPSVSGYFGPFPASGTLVGQPDETLDPLTIMSAAFASIPAIGIWEIEAFSPEADVQVKCRRPMQGNTGSAHLNARNPTSQPDPANPTPGIGGNCL